MKLPVILLFLHLWGNVEVSLSQNACSMLPDVPNAHVSKDTKKAEYQEGDMIHFTCETGYTSSQTSTYVCLRDGWLTVRQGTCYSCSTLPDVPHAHISEETRKADYREGDMIHFTCEPGYMSHSTIKYVCMSAGWLAIHQGKCYTSGSNCDPPPANGEITVNGLPENDDPILPDHIITFSCDSPGKHLSGSSVLKCGDDGQWNNTFPSCEDITCKLEKMDPHITVSITPSTEPIKIGHKLQFQCNRRYTLEGSVENECLETGQWSAPFPTCSEKCEVTGVPGSVRIETQVPNNLLGKGQSLKFLCRRYDHFIQGKAKVECLGNGQWSHTFPTCGLAVSCQRPPPLENGDTRESPRLQYRHNERVEYVCQSFYTMEGDRYKTCINGEWTGQMRCLKPCTVDREVMSQRNIAFRYSRDDKLYSPHNDVIEFSCTSYRGRPVGRVAMRQKCVDGVINLPTCQ